MQWSAKDIRDYLQRVGDWNATWAAYDEPLRAACDKYPRHDRLDGVIAKVGLVQRAYEAGLERHVRRRAENAIVVVARALHQARHRIDPEVRYLRRVVGNGKQFDAARLAATLTVHASVLKVIQKKTRGGNAPRSFVSKYLHFHCAGVPIFDERARKMMGHREWYGWRETSRRVDVRALDVPRAADPQYARYLQQFLAMWNDARESGIRPNVRSLDAYLVSWSETLRNRARR